jgi:TetR/AcrR family transcriptional repressor of nem operon
MRYPADHKARTHRRIIKRAARQFRAEGLGGPGVVKVMQASGLTHGGFYKHFASKEDLLIQAIEESLREIGGKLTDWAGQAPDGQAWQEIVSRYLSIEHCEHANKGCPMAALAPDIARSAPLFKKRIAPGMRAYREQLARFMPGKGPAEKSRNLMVIFAAMLGAIAIARTMSDRESKRRLLSSVREHLLASF